MSEKKNRPPRATVKVTQQLELPTPLQQVKLDSLMVRCWRAGREVLWISADHEIQEDLRRSDSHATLAVFWRKHMEGIIYVDNDGRTISAAAHKGLHDLMVQNAKAGEWPSSTPDDYYEGLRHTFGTEPNRAEIEEAHREFGWID
ncbi:hypothetical protein GCM10022631_11530 [Deinococcus rubellus]|uniref:Uncharacterized protein n=1 Tax=Deinococcus rubellus TaxID=1889240 RepID=A0ABY5YFD5_9DEIO|nr:hypothetical protein [Deinococcus rubellus]UWX62802.1 hypothetical protein N0D28_08445 [Deinococcus rubellus]